MKSKDNVYWKKRQLVESLGEILDANRSTALDVARDDAENALGQLDERTVRECEIIALEVDTLSRGNFYAVFRSVHELVSHVTQGLRHDFFLTKGGKVVLNFKSHMERDKFLRNVPVASIPSRKELKAVMLERLLKQT